MALSAIERAVWQAAQAREQALAQDTKRRFGVVHTPPELARAVLRVSDALLREQLGVRDGVCDPRLLVIDPACGPGAFFAAALALAEEREPLASVRGLGFDLDATALGRASQLRAHAAGSALQFAQADLLDGAQLLAAASAHAGPLLVIANPPWSSQKSQATALSQQLLSDFRVDADGVRLPERKLGVLADAYVRSFRVCAEAARRSRAGAVVALVSNGSYLDGPVHRGMRAALLRWFDRVCVLDLGGSALLGRDGEARDENVFGVRPSVAVTWLVRRPADAHGSEGRLRYLRWSGTRRDKLARLAGFQHDAAAFTVLTPEPPLLRFVPTSRRDRVYAAYPSLAAWLPFHREGVQSNRDAVAIDGDRARLLERLRAFAHGRALPELELAYRALSHYDPQRARLAVAEALERDPDGTLGVSVQAIAYRPLDERSFCPVTPLCHRPRPELARALAWGGAALVSVRKDRGDVPWRHAAWVSTAVDNCYLSARSSCRARAFPACTPVGDDNLAPELRERLAAVGSERVDALAFMHYALAILSASSYRERWDAELRQDYPRIPLPPTAAGFRRLSELGATLAALYAAPLAEPERAVSEPPSNAHFGELVLSAADGCVSLAGTRLLELEPLAFELRIGHHRPLHGYLAARAAQPLTRAGLRAVIARAERLGALAHVRKQLDRVTGEEFGWQRC